jgi:hypothetical protein
MTDTLPGIIAGIAWDPQIRGILAVLVGTVVLGGSVYLLMATNIGQRLGFMLALAALFGWMTIHGLVWWIFPPGNGPAGRQPAWEIEEVNHGDLTQSMLEDARDLDPSGLPSPEDISEMTPEQVEEVSEQDADQLSDWALLPEGDASRGEAQTTVDAYLADGNIAGLSTPETYVYLYAFETGGKPERDGDSVWDRVSNRVANTLRIFHPAHYAVVQLQPAIPQEEVAGQAPPTPEPDQNAEVISVVLERDLGQRRLPAALVTLGSGAVFGLLCVMLHKRDQRVAEHHSAPLPATTGSE